MSPRALSGQTGQLGSHHLFKLTVIPEPVVGHGTSHLEFLGFLVLQ